MTTWLFKRLGIQGLRLHSKIFLAQLAVIAVGAATLLMAMSLIAPLFFDQLWVRAMEGMMGPGGMMGSGGLGGMMTGMADSLNSTTAQVFQEAVTYSLAVGTAVSILAAMVVSMFVSRRLVEPVSRLVGASHRIAAGHYAERVDASASDEIGDLAQSFNAMAASLEETERRRLALVGDVAHELRTPLATIEGYAEGLIDGVVEPTPETFALLHTEAGRLRRLVDDLQELSRAEAHQIALHPRPVPAARLLEMAGARLNPQFAEKGVALAVGAADGLPAVLADEDRTVQALVNLLGNALRYTPAGGRVDLAARRRGGLVEFAVADTGVGIPAESLPHIFERFYRVDRSRSRTGGGSGIGLTIAKHLAEAQGGTLRAESPGPGRGATFTLALPIAP
ncbi:MAG: ATP-binding protein [Dehalococcoidales bacterium]|nr:ATP-binding protein [Dehalococcoidales bacterium]